jgi:probable H4MPT-linked C1 transfer pathway protein
MQSIIGWDIGGAHLKAARFEDGRIVKVAQVACPLWLGLDELHRAFAEAKSMVGTADLNAATMTAELCDAFASREEGVNGVAALTIEELAPKPVLFYAGAEGFVAVEAAAAHATKIASANWHASASLARLTHRNALFVDMGSTTTDVIPVIDSKVKTIGYSDASRLANGELVYAGVVRSYLMSSGIKLVPFGGRWVPLMNEWFAATCDIYRLLGELPEDADVMETADGREKTVEASKARLARMLGYDGPEADLSAWQQLARYFAEVQLRDLTDAAHLVLSRGEVVEDAPLIGAGAGRFVVKRLAERLGRTFIDFSDLIAALPEVKAKACDCAPASAVAFLAADASQLR